MKAYVVRDAHGSVVRGWVVAKGPPQLSARDRAWLANSKRRLEEVSTETAFCHAASPCGGTAPLLNSSQRQDRS